MSTPAEKFLDWLTLYVDSTGYTVSRGQWTETDATASKKFVAVWISPGRPPVAGVVQYPIIDVIVTGRRNGRALGDTPGVETFAHGIIEAAIEHHSTGCIASIHPRGGISGPKYTETDRPTYRMTFELIT
jgi:hypothetical protein